MVEINSGGLIIDEFNEIVDANIESFKLNPKRRNLKSGETSTFGHINRVLSTRESDIQESLMSVVSNSHPNTAIGVFLDYICEFDGLTRNAVNRSTVTITLTAHPTVAVIVPAGTEISDPDNSSVCFATDTEVSLLAGDHADVTATAVTDDPISAEPGTLTKVNTPIYGLETVINIDRATVGNREETDGFLRLRRGIASTSRSLSDEGWVYTQLANLSGVTEVAIYHNASNIVDQYGVPPGNMWAIVRGSINPIVASCIYYNKIAGVPTFGSISENVVDEISGVAHTIYFSRPTDVEIDLEISLSKNSGYPSNGDDQIKTAILAFFAGDFTVNEVNNSGVNLGQNLILSRLSAPVNIVGGHYINYIHGRRHGTSIWVNDYLTVDVNEKLIVSIGNITIS